MATVDLGSIRFNWKGAYSGGTAYVVDDVVSSGGSSYICIQAHAAGTQAVSETAYWSVMAEAGATLPAYGADGNVLTSTGSAWASEAAAGGGKVLQWQSTALSTVFTSTSATMAVVTGLTVDITPTATTSKILVIAQISGSQHPGSNNFYLALQRDSTLLNVGSGVTGSRVPCTFQLMTSNSGWTASGCAIYLDPNTPADTSTAMTYKIMGRSENAATTWFINRSHGDYDSTTGGRQASSITVVELGPN